MRVRAILVLLAAFTLGASARPVHAQSLADVVRHEGERRAAVKDQGKTLTNKDLPDAPATASTPAAAAPAPTPAADDANAVADAKDGKKDQKYWADKMNGLKDKVEEDKVLADAVQTRVNSLTTDFVNRDDPAQRAVIATDKQKAIDELARLKQAIVTDTKAIADLEEEARKAGVPPGWLR